MIEVEILEMEKNRSERVGGREGGCGGGGGGGRRTTLVLGLT